MAKKKDKSKKKKEKEKSGKSSKKESRRVVNKGESSVYNAVPNSDTDTSARESSKNLKKKKRDRRDDDDDYDEDVHRLERKPSPVLAPLPTLSKEEYDFFKMVYSGDVNGVQEGLGSFGNINMINRHGYTVLHFAVRRQDDAMTDLLLQQSGIKLYDTLLHAIQENNVDITRKLLEVYDKHNSEEKKHQFMSSLGGLGTPVPTADVHSTSAPISLQSGVKSSVRINNKPRFEPPPITIQPRSQFPFGSVSIDEDDTFDSQFPPVISPLMLSAQIGSYPLMDLFYGRGERLETPEFHHNLKCSCDICAKLEGDQDMTRAHQRFHLFNSITQPHYMCFIAKKEKKDPVNYAISKLIKLRKVCERDTAFDQRYTVFVERLETFIKDLVNLCRNTRETEIFFSPKDPDEEERLPHLYPRLWYAVGLNLTDVVAHANTQNIVYNVWAGDDWPEWDTFGFLYKAFNLVIRIVGFPIIALILMVAQNTKLGRTLGAPVSRFLTFIGSYIFFLGLVGFQVLWPYQRCNHVPPYYQIPDDQCKERGPPQIGTEWPIVIYVMSFYLSMLKRNSVSWYWSMKWNWFDLAGQLAFTATFGCWAWAWMWKQMPENQALIMATDRAMWPHNCAEVFGECFLSVASMFAFGRLLRFIQVLPTIGPIQVGLGRQIADFLSAGLIYVSVLFAFASGLLALYVPYKDFKGHDSDGKEKTQDGTFTSMESTMSNLFWYLYGAGGKDPATLLSWPQGNITNKTGSVEEIHHDYTQFTGVGLYLCYHVIGQMMMFSMLSAYFAHSLSKIQDEMDVHWKFERTELYLTFIKDTMLPPPFNLFPSVASIGEGMRFFSLIGKKDDPRAACSAKQCCYITTGTNKKDKWSKLVKGYRKLIVELMYRYGTFKEEEDAEAAATRDDVKEIGEELAEIKAMLERKKGGSGTVGGGSSSDDNKFPPAKDKKKWSKVKHVLDNGSSYLKIVPSKKGSSGRPVVTSQPKSPITTTLYSAPSQQSVPTKATPSKAISAPLMTSPTPPPLPRPLSKTMTTDDSETTDGRHPPPVRTSSSKSKSKR